MAEAVEAVPVAVPVALAVPVAVVVAMAKNLTATVLLVLDYKLFGTSYSNLADHQPPNVLQRSSLSA